MEEQGPRPGSRLGPASGVTDLRLSLPAVVGWIAAVVLVGVPTAATVVAVTAGVVALLLILLAVRVPTGWIRMLCSIGTVSALVVGLVAVATAVAWGQRSPRELGSIVGDGTRAEIELIADRDVDPSARSFPGTVRRITTASSRSTLSGVPVRVVPDQHGPDTAHAGAGAVLRVEGDLQPEPPGSEAVVVVFARSDIVVVREPIPLLAATDTARTAFSDLTSDLPMPGAGLLGGLAIGDRSGLDDETAAAMQTSALTHLTAVSGDTSTDGGGCPASTMTECARSLMSATLPG